MTIAERLDELRARHSGCVLVAFGDLDTRLILRTSAEEALPQEQLDRLCNQAVDTFSLSDAARADESRGSEAFVMTPMDTRIIVRSEAGGSDFLCCVCEGDEAVPAIAECAREVLREVSTL